MKRESVSSKAVCEPSNYAVADHFVDAYKMVGRQSTLNAPVDLCPATGYRSAHIRPVAVRPLDHPERWPTPRGFLFPDFETNGFRQNGRSEP